MDVELRQVAANEGERLREIAVAAKASWGYDVQRVRKWAALGDFSVDGLELKNAFVALVGDEVVGWAGAMQQGDVLWLDDLWIDPDWMNRGIVTALFRHAVALAREAGVLRMEWEAEPHAIGFYEKLGGRYLRDGDLSLWGRVNPVMGLDLQ
jgi:GNAT superfamily N-acetyltransferase